MIKPDVAREALRIAHATRPQPSRAPPVPELTAELVANAKLTARLVLEGRVNAVSDEAVLELAIVVFHRGWL